MRRPPLRISLPATMIAIAQFAAIFALHKLTHYHNDNNYILSIFINPLSIATSSLVVLNTSLTLMWLGAGSMPARHLVRHPGFSGPAIASLASSCMLFLRAGIHDPDFLLVFPMLLWGFTGTAVAAGWLLMALTDLWWPVPCWKDKAGRLLGFLWLSGAIVLWFIVSVR